MNKRLVNFTAGPSMLPLPVLQRIREEMLDYRGMGASIMEISHRTSEFSELRAETVSLVRELLRLPDDFEVLFAAGGGVLQMALAPMNLIARRPGRKALFVHTDIFSGRAIEEAGKYGNAVVIASGESEDFSAIPEVDSAALDSTASYMHIVTNNTARGTMWRYLPQCESLPLVGDATSELFGRELDLDPFGMLFAGCQKNLGISGMSLVLVREQMLGHAIRETPSWMNCQVLADTDSMPSTSNTFALYVCNLMLHWFKSQGGVKAIEGVNRAKAARLYAVLDRGDFYRGHAHPAHRSIMNVCFQLPTPELEHRFVEEAASEGLYALRGHRAIGGLRASMYNAMPMSGAEALAQFMEEFERRA